LGFDGGISYTKRSFISTLLRLLDGEVVFVFYPGGNTVWKKENFFCVVRLHRWDLMGLFHRQREVLFLL
jgi:hypothetical protein